MALADFFGKQERRATSASLAARLGFTDRAVPGQAVPQNHLRRPVVQESGDLERILALPEREVIEVLDFSWLKKKVGKCRCADMGRPCCKDLLPIQAQALSEAARVGGLYASVGVGHGKELVFELLPMVMEGVKTAVLFIGPEMRESFKADWEYYGQHWQQPNLVGGSSFVPGLPRLKVIAYSELSHEKSTAAMRSWDPDLVMGNEAHNLACLTSVRTRRVIDWGASKPACKFVWGSGTLSVRSIRDSSHLAALALGEGSPFPIDEQVLAEWAAAIDPADARGGKLPALMGALRRLCRPGETAREAFKRRRRTTPGVIDTSEQSIPNALVMHRREPPPIPPAALTALEQVRKTSCRPDGEEFTDQVQVARCLHQLAAGFYYKWIYPHGEPPELIDRWFRARQEWNREVRDLLLYPRPYLDSPALAMRAALRGEMGLESTPEKPVWRSRTFAAWKEVHKLVRPVQKAEWLSDWLARDAAAWAAEKPGIVWYASKTFGAKIEELSGLKRYGGGSQANEEILRESGKVSVLASMKAYHKNFNLQMFHRNLITQSWPDAAMWEQGIGRTHRRGQVADEVHNWLYLHTPELRRTFDHARKLAEFVEQTSPNKMKLCRATYTWKLDRG